MQSITDLAQDALIESFERGCGNLAVTARSRTDALLRAVDAIDGHGQLVLLTDDALSEAFNRGQNLTASRSLTDALLAALNVVELHVPAARLGFKIA